MKLVTVSGPRGAGKEEVMRYLVEAFPAALHRIVPHTTRAPRPGECHGREYYFVNDVEFDGLFDRGEFIFVNDKMAHQRSGTVRAELTKKSLAVIDITDFGARELCSKVVVEGGRALLVFVYASREERRGRIRLRQPSMNEDEVERLLSDDPVDPLPGAHLDFDLVVENRNGQLNATLDRIGSLIAQFLLL